MNMARAIPIIILFLWAVHFEGEGLLKRVLFVYARGNGGKCGRPLCKISGLGIFQLKVRLGRHAK